MNEDSLNASEKILELTEIIESNHKYFKEVGTDSGQSDSSLSLKNESGCEDTANIFENDNINLTILKLERIEAQIERLSNEFKSKLKYDAHKEKIIGQLHEELHQFKNNIIKKQIIPIVTDLIKMIDGISKFSTHHTDKNTSALDSKKLFGFIKGLPSELEDILLSQGVNSFTCNNEFFDPSRQRIVKKITTTDKSKDKFVIKTVYPGYEYAGQLLRPEMVQILIYKSLNRKSSDE